jgi:tRNA modification GTPase
VADDTIFALASGQGVAGIAVFRISGPGADGAAAALAGALPPPRSAELRALRRPGDGTLIDRGLVLRFPAPHSFTGEDVVELHVHGGRAVSEAVAAALGALPGLRPAEAGEFTRRAFINGKVDLAEAEGLADLVAAETEAQRLQALDQFSGGLSRRFEAWRESVTGLMAEVEATVDFADEELPAGLLDGLKYKILRLKSDLTQYMGDRNLGERLRSGFQIAIVGAPNVGKSSILNVLARRDVAIVSEVEGTTRDVIEVHLDLGGLPVIVADTAGLRETADSIEAEGVRRAAGRAGTADLRLIVADARDWPRLDPAVARFLGPGCLVVVNKIDLLPEPADISEAEQDMPVIAVSARTGQGIDHMLALVESALGAHMADLAPAPMTRERHRRALAEAIGALERALALTDAEQSPELLAEELRLAARALGRIAGRVDVEDVLDRVFSRFCIGK